MPLVSVIIPAHNRAPLLREAVASVLAQDFTDFELIVVDDGSTDETGEILCSVPRVIAVRQAHRGVSAARNAGIARAAGRFIAFLDSDDLWLPAKLSRQVAFLESRPDVRICQVEEMWVRRGVRVNLRRRYLKPSGWIFESSLDVCLVSASAVMIEAGLLREAGGFDENLPACEDYDLWLRLACRLPIPLIGPPLVVKRGGHADQLSRMPGLDQWRIRSLEKIIRSGSLSPAQRSLALAALRRKCAIFGQGCVKRGRIDEAREILALPERLEAAAPGE